MLKGIDLHSDKWVDDWSAVKSNGIQVVINKATEGTYYKDKYLPYRYNTCKKLGLHIGTYHFAGHEDVNKEVQFFVDYTKGMEFDAMYWLDIEQPPSSYSWRWEGTEPSEFVNKFISTFKKLTGHSIGVYSGLSFYNTYLKDKIPNDTKLWIASYGVNHLPIPNHSWQYTSKGSVKGINGSVDMDLFQPSIIQSTSNFTLRLVVCHPGPDERAANYLADKLQCPVILSTNTGFPFSSIKKIYAVGGTKEQYKSIPNIVKLISGADRFETMQLVLNYIKENK
ncbi:MAG: hypothetical protein ACFWT2_15515 [Thermoanaerobacterium thermosaccharolyticum]|jgi:lysozyme